jgi:alkyl hydroperoxide reductase subunit AhpC
LTHHRIADYADGQDERLCSNPHVYVLLLSLLRHAGVFLERSLALEIKRPPAEAAEVGFLFQKKDWDCPKEEEIDMSLRINDIAPDFTAETTHGTIQFHEWIGDGWAVLFSHPKDFTPVCTTELGAVAGLESQFAQRGAKVIGLSVDPVGSHEKWAADIEEVTGHAVKYPMIGDPELKVAKLYDMLPADAGDSCEGRTPANNATVRVVYVIGPDKRIKLTLAYPMTTGRNFDEIIRVLDSIQLTAKHRVATPANWTQGGDVIITGAVTNDEADKIFPGYKTVKPYLRTVGQPE